MSPLLPQSRKVRWSMGFSLAAPLPRDSMSLLNTLYCCLSSSGMPWAESLHWFKWSKFLFCFIPLLSKKNMKLLLSWYSNHLPNIKSNETPKSGCSHPPPPGMAGPCAIRSQSAVETASSPPQIEQHLQGPSGLYFLSLEKMRSFLWTGLLCP